MTLSLEHMVTKVVAVHRGAECKLDKMALKGSCTWDFQKFNIQLFNKQAFSGLDTIHKTPHLVEIIYIGGD
jgi:hypothetical protein